MSIAEEEAAEDMATYLVEDHVGLQDVHEKAKQMRTEGMHRRRAFAEQLAEAGARSPGTASDPASRRVLVRSASWRPQAC